jgi:serine/threonine protein phosphatase PrpC
MTDISSQFKTDIATATAGVKNQDRTAVIKHPHGLLLVIADGAGGLAGGSEAAELVIQIIRESALSKAEFANPLVWSNILTEADNQLYEDSLAGETTAVVVALCDGSICGASVGDSGAFLLQEKTDIELTVLQQRKPPLGSGAALPIPYGSIPFVGTLLVATDGLIKYAQKEKICQIVLENDFEEGAKLLTECVRYPSGNLPDDVTVIVCQKNI